MIGQLQVYSLRDNEAGNVNTGIHDSRRMRIINQVESLAEADTEIGHLSARQLHLLKTWSLLTTSQLRAACQRGRISQTGTHTFTKAKLILHMIKAVRLT
eukprot:TRINITY_DN29968_c0_g3_i1.p1 TRINITY_DN29968_c0_g3~~TRINITY_DN29968_c0_g3_i1.p1  ORF type:complete len:100 (+),score=10.30 TRINITY_DN29968_c0_g3_i1:582-881(+)